FAEQMKRIDWLTQEQFGVSSAILMERAAIAVMDAMEERYGALSGKRIYICCGKGNNGGDGFALARLLTEKMAHVTTVLAFEGNSVQGLAAQNMQLAIRFGVQTKLWNELTSNELREADIIIDALLGTGAIGEPSGPVAELISAVNRCGKPVVAVDIPSGVFVDTGGVNDIAIKADLTVTFGLPKPGLLCYPGVENTGQLIIRQVGFPRQLIEDEALHLNFLTDSDIRLLLPKRPSTAHKGTNGHLLVIGGSMGMTGAAVLASLAGLRIGCGLVTAGVRQDLSIVEKPAEVMLMPWPELTHRWDNFQSFVFGPGLTTTEDGESFLFELLEHGQAPLVIDADGLNLMANNPKFFKHFQQPVVLTPHPGEMSRLSGMTVAEIQADRIGVARRFAEEWQVTLVLKGARTIVAAADGKVFINPTGNPGMATGGTGDVLAGVIGGLIAQGLEATDAAIAGVYLHGLAGDIAASELGPIGLIASDIISVLPNAIKRVLTD
ncbi:MAG TPA: bifunctional ADP-dependent NAD(P)H-hydrate dehydratase/NAD(P)H-hydrate epimerase, partial [Firmicutes bacterium]|nr:bifunctional ADP-dependent NAD(P)H-hydrate dehydratase/NAD(P)H-hydrate epimerase [Bacillota bacterium]